ncbi:unnamed protein product [Vitrella brassicaformis CCMP3155]|uniref:RanBP2-type domain-containing protein n=1 Tax=Vitrella brassicaformis (strain CCMP3155) TaxID=1169540 RepID=A0A0G4EFJ1_VITBC|nr:unnamed protein product [Vitrella brassicaformis CCMP3155]|eukprot:CEL94761.1 unnamed protein product [Vitrella brassicaformis CCMP3155]
MDPSSSKSAPSVPLCRSPPPPPPPSATPLPLTVTAGRSGGHPTVGYYPTYATGHSTYPGHGLVGSSLPLPGYQVGATSEAPATAAGGQDSHNPFTSPQTYGYFHPQYLQEFSTRLSQYYAAHHYPSTIAMGALSAGPTGPYSSPQELSPTRKGDGDLPRLSPSTAGPAPTPHMNSAAIYSPPPYPPLPPPCRTSPPPPPAPSPSVHASTSITPPPFPISPYNMPFYTHPGHAHAHSHTHTHSHPHTHTMPYAHPLAHQHVAAATAAALATAASMSAGMAGAGVSVVREEEGGRRQVFDVLEWLRDHMGSSIQGSVDDPLVGEIRALCCDLFGLPRVGDGTIPPVMPHPYIIAHPDEFKNASSFLKIYGDPLAAQALPSRGRERPVLVKRENGNWECGKCANINYPRRFKCNKCNEVRSEEGDMIVREYALHVYFKIIKERGPPPSSHTNNTSTPAHSTGGHGHGPLLPLRPSLSSTLTSTQLGSTWSSAGGGRDTPVGGMAATLGRSSSAGVIPPPPVKEDDREREREGGRNA